MSKDQRRREPICILPGPSQKLTNLGKREGEDGTRGQKYYASKDPTIPFGNIKPWDRMAPIPQAHQEGRWYPVQCHLSHLAQCLSELHLIANVH